ncbi:MAG: hypothetical protein HDT29_00830 [Clostridiales bacterium]|nr:hypothetical protein [Clostridiales bacterium]
MENDKGYDKELDYLDLDDELDQDGNILPEKTELTEDLISGDKDAKKIVESLYKNLSFAYGIYEPQHLLGALKYLSYSVSILFFLTSIFLVVSMLVIRIDRSQIPMMVAPAILCLFFGIFSMYFFITRDQARKVWWYKDSKKTIAIYKSARKSEESDIIIYVNKNYQYRYYHKKQEWKKNRSQCMDTRLLFKHLNGKLRIENHKNGDVEIYTRNPSLYSFYNEEAKQKSASILIRDGIPNYIEHWYDSAEQGRSNVSERFEFLEINTDRYVEIPKSFITFCQVQRIEPLQENEHLRYV